jgi:NTP pyrophosphatase (non-canonical NTP hydrolase)
MDQAGFDKARGAALAFRDERDWAQFHNPKDLALSISLEAAELLEVFQWSGADLECADRRERVREELADVVIYAIYLADREGFDLCAAVLDKVAANAEKYPVARSRGRSTKYVDL